MAVWLISATVFVVVTVLGVVIVIETPDLGVWAN
jgi:uncharacterized membrane protein